MDQFENRYGSNENPNKKRSGKGFVIALISVLSVLIIASTAFLVHEVISLKNGGSTEAGPSDRMTLADADQSAGEAEQTLGFNESDEIKMAETKSRTTVIDVSEVVENVMPSVVSIVDQLESTTRVFDPYSYFFGGGGSGSSEQYAEAGSGVIIGVNDNELLIVTNDHVVDNETSSSYYTVSSKGLLVTFINGEEAPAVIKGTDSNSDLAVISVKMSDLSSETKDAIRIAVLGSSEDAKIGSGVIVIGNAGGYGQSVTSGIISAKEREVTIDNVTRKLIQTDAAVNPGNSGGGMFNANGELIGINSAKTVSTDIEGMGFAIPISSVRSIIENLMNREPVAEGEEGYLGINGESIPSNYITYYNYPAGVSITRIIEGSPAEQAGLQIYDIINKINGISITSMSDLKKTINSYKAGTTVTLTVYRSEGRSFKEFTVDVTLVKESELGNIQ